MSLIQNRVLQAAVALSLVACASARTGAASSESGGCRAARRGAIPLEPLSRQGSAVALARRRGPSGARLIAFVANRAGKRVDEVDVERGAVVRRRAVSGEPDQILVMPDGRLIVSLGDHAALEILGVDEDEGSTSKDACLVDVPSGPAGLALSEDASKVVVASTLASSLTVLDATNLATTRSVPVPRSPFGAAIEGSRAFVTHLSGARVSVVDLAGSAAPRSVDLGLYPATAIAPEDALTTERTGAQAYALVTSVGTRRRIIVPEVTVDPGDGLRSAIYYGAPQTLGIAKEAPVAPSVDVDTEKPDMSHFVAISDGGFRDECLLPRAAAIRASTDRLYVACRGIDQVLELDADAADPMRGVLRRFDVPRGATGVAVADREGVMAAFGEFDEKLALVGLTDGSRRDVDLSGAGVALSLSYREGRELFYRSNDPRIAFDGIACASCHPDGRDDGLTWSTPEGPRQTPMLAGRLHGTEPYGWTRSMGTLPEYIADTIQRLGGHGLDHSSVIALASFIERMPGPSTGHLGTGDPSRGKDVFVRAGCGECHVEAVGTDHRSHTVLSGDVSSDGGYDTPSLRFVGLTAPYFHDGRYSNLEQVLGDKESHMGNTRYLSQGDQLDLARFLGTL